MNITTARIPVTAATAQFPAVMQIKTTANTISAAIISGMV